jgi:hypothetical protein
MTGVSSLIATSDAIADRWSEDAKATIGTDVAYADDQEYGPHGKPYLRPAGERAARNIEAFAAQADGSAELVMLAALYGEGVAKSLVQVDTGNLRSSLEARQE